MFLGVVAVVVDSVVGVGVVLVLVVVVVVVVVDAIAVVVDAAVGGHYYSYCSYYCFFL